MSSAIMASCKKPGRKIFEKLPFDVLDVGEYKTPKYNIFGRSLVLIGPKRYAESNKYKMFGLDIYNFEARPDDVYLVGYPRSGTTLHCEMVWQIGNDLDYEGAGRDFLDYRFPHIDFAIMPQLDMYKEVAKNKDATEEMKDIAEKYQQLDLKGLSERKGRRFIKSHLPLSLMPPHIFEVGAKVIYCARNPRDVLVSIYRASSFFKLVQSKLEFKDMFDQFTDNSGWSCPFFEHVKEGWDRRNDNNFLFLFYEDTMKDKRQTIKKVADFLDKNLSEGQIDSLEEYLSLENFKNNQSVNGHQLIKLGEAHDNGQFIRQGKSGEWRDLFDEEMDTTFSQWLEENLRGSDLRFPGK